MRKKRKGKRKRKKQATKIPPWLHYVHVPYHQKEFVKIITTT
jgi:hypothetical protein